MSKTALKIGIRGQGMGANYVAYDVDTNRILPATEFTLHVIAGKPPTCTVTLLVEEIDLLDLQPETKVKFVGRLGPEA